TFNLNDQIDHDNGDATGTGDTAILALDLTAAFTAEDFDHDPVTLPDGTLVVNVENDVPTATATIDRHILDDENQAFGISGGPGDDGSGTVTTGTLNAQPGADEPISFAFAESVVVTDSNNNTVAQLQAIFVDANSVGHKENVSLLWTPDGSGGGTLT